MKSYIGITDFAARSETEHMLSVFERLSRGRIPHMLMIGVMMNHGSLRNFETKWSRVFSKREAVANIFVRHPLALNTLHYADYHNVEVMNSLIQAIFWGGIDIDAIQLDMTWPDPGTVATAVHASRKHIHVILQIGRSALEEAGEDPQEVLRRLRDYEEVIHGVLFDQSMGEGRLMDAESLLRYIRPVRSELNFHIAVAGGLGPGTVSLAGPIVREFPDVSFDAQGRLRPSGSLFDPIDWRMASAYLNEVVALLAAHQPPIVQRDSR